MTLTQEQLQELESGEPVRIRIGRTRCVIFREDVFSERIDTDVPTMEELSLLACQAADMIQDSLDEPL